MLKTPLCVIPCLLGELLVRDVAHEEAYGWGSQTHYRSQPALERPNTRRNDQAVLHDFRAACLEHTADCAGHTPTDVVAEGSSHAGAAGSSNVGAVSCEVRRVIAPPYRRLPCELDYSLADRFPINKFVTSLTKVAGAVLARSQVRRETQYGTDAILRI
jgi:hypothetical protein